MMKNSFTAQRALRGWQWLAATPTLALILAASPAQAEDGAPAKAATEGGQAIQDIVVTAQHRSENAQKTALSIDVFSGDTLRKAGVTQPDDLTRLAPGVQASGGTTTQIYVRGIGDFGVTATANPAVVTNLDGVVISRPQAISGNFFDLDRVELLKGPQGTLYGRNASGGALNILTVQPKLGELSGYADATVGNYKEYGIEGAFNIPAGQNGAFRLSYQLNHRDGYLSDGSDDDKHESLRLQSKFVFDRLTLRSEFTYIHLGGEGTGLVPVEGLLPGQSPWTGVTSTVAGNGYIRTAAANFVNSGYTSPPPSLLANPAGSTLFQNVNTYSASLQADYALDFATLTIIPAYRRTTSRFAIAPSFLYNVGGDYDADGNSSPGETSDQYSLEARLGHQSGRLKWVIGGYYFKENQGTGYALNGGLILNTLNIMDLKTETAAGFGQLTYSILDRLRVTGGIRYTSDKRSTSNFQLDTITPDGTLTSLINSTPGYYNSSVTFNKVTWKAGLEADLARQSMAFIDVSTGFKAGGFNQAVSLTNPNQLLPFSPETDTAYTVGIKNRFFDNKLQLNVEAFYIDYKNLQLSAQGIDGSGNISLITQNAGKARIFGADIDIIAKPWNGGTIHASLEYDNSKYQQFEIQQLAEFVPPGRTSCPVSSANSEGLVTVNCSGQPLIRSPKWSGEAGISQIFGLAWGGDVTFDADAAFASNRYLDTDFLASQLARGYANVSASLTYNAPAHKWFVSAFVRNLTNVAIYTGGGGNQSGFVTGWTTSSIAPPRTYGVRFGVKF